MEMELRLRYHLYLISGDASLKYAVTFEYSGLMQHDAQNLRAVLLSETDSLCASDDKRGLMITCSEIWYCGGDGAERLKWCCE